MEVTSFKEQRISSMTIKMSFMMQSEISLPHMFLLQDLYLTLLGIQPSDHSIKSCHKTHMQWIKTIFDMFLAVEHQSLHHVSKTITCIWWLQEFKFQLLHFLTAQLYALSSHIHRSLDTILLMQITYHLSQLQLVQVQIRLPPLQVMHLLDHLTLNKIHPSRSK